jgi:hypothetical protein
MPLLARALLLPSLLATIAAAACGEDQANSALRDGGLGDSALSDGRAGAAGAWHQEVSPPPEPFVCPTDASDQCEEPSPGFSEVLPVFVKYCQRCHGYASYEVAYGDRENLLSDTLGCYMVPQTVEEWRLLVAWLRCGAPLEGGAPGVDASADASADASVPEDGPSD